MHLEDTRVRENHSFIQQVFLHHLLWARNHSQHGAQYNKQNRPGQQILIHVYRRCDNMVLYEKKQFI